MRRSTATSASSRSLSLGLLAAPTAAHAHPLGNFTINTAAGLVRSRGRGGRRLRRRHGGDPHVAGATAVSIPMATARSRRRETRRVPRGRLRGPPDGDCASESTELPLLCPCAPRSSPFRSGRPDLSTLRLRCVLRDRDRSGATHDLTFEDRELRGPARLARGHGRRRRRHDRSIRRPEREPERSTPLVSRPTSAPSHVRVGIPRRSGRAALLFLAQPGIRSGGAGERWAPRRLRRSVRSLGRA